MLPILLGGVALAVTGYGIGKFFEDEVSCRSSKADLSDVMDRYEDIKSKLCEVNLKELQLALKEIENFEKSDDILVYDVSTDSEYDFLTLSDNVESHIDKYVDLLEDTQDFISTQLDKLDEIIIKSNDFSSYSDEEQAFVQELIDFNNTIVNVCSSKVTPDGKIITRETKRAFGKIEVALSK